MTRFGIAMLRSKDGDFEFHEGVWVRTYDPDAEEETELTFTDDPTEALAYGSRQAAFDVLLRVSTERPVNREGKLLRPLTDAYDVEVRELPEAA